MFKIGSTLMGAGVGFVAGGPVGAIIGGVTDSSFPSFWQDSDNRIEDATVSVLRGSNEYEDVERRIARSISGEQCVTIKKILRVQNTDLFSQYRLYKEKIDKEIKGNSDIAPVYHGTEEDVAIKLCFKGFNRNFNKTGAYGKGSYFARDIKYSLRNPYSPINEHGEKFIFECQIVAGKYCNGHGKMKEPPEGYHSTVDNENNPTLFSIYHDSGSYQLWLIILQTASKPIQGNLQDLDERLAKKMSPAKWRECLDYRDMDSLTLENLNFPDIYKSKGKEDIPLTWEKEGSRLKVGLVEIGANSNEFNDITYLGEGTYFHRTSAGVLKEQESEGKLEGQKILLECQIIVGCFCQGYLDMKEPANNCDSTVDNMDNPNEFSIYHDSDAYPAYLIVFENETERILYTSSIFRIVKDRIENQKSDIIAYSSPFTMDLSSSNIPQSLWNKAGNELQQECKQKQGSVKSGEIIVTGGYNLHCEEICGDGSLEITMVIFEDDPKLYDIKDAAKKIFGF
ncbi:DgyrCDS3852 [Dimorphilus gyrociliatus]|uniref:Poly [ADP-ribose] polymerase n=1 Tax=Dimorphilus gyrociliatus TaxID=2664684 RepID=A0A7I8VGI1_9ANNE|nr:DgyrCDS3852 [Dimorphilus gyrociliatus]